MPIMIHSSPVTSSQLWVDRILMRVKTSTNVPIIIRYKPQFVAFFFIKTLIFVQK